MFVLQEVLIPHGVPIVQEVLILQHVPIDQEARASLFGLCLH